MATNDKKYRVARGRGVACGNGSVVSDGAYLPSDHKLRASHIKALVIAKVLYPAGEMPSAEEQQQESNEEMRAQLEAIDKSEADKEAKRKREAEEKVKALNDEQPRNLNDPGLQNPASKPAEFEGKWDFDPEEFKEASLEDLNIMIAERDPSITAFTDLQEAVSFISSDFKPADK